MTLFKTIFDYFRNRRRSVFPLRVSSKLQLCCFHNHRCVLFLVFAVNSLYAVFKVLAIALSFRISGGLKWTRTTDLTLIRRAL